LKKTKIILWINTELFFLYSKVCNIYLIKGKSRLICIPLFSMCFLKLKRPCRDVCQTEDKLFYPQKNLKLKSCFLLLLLKSTLSNIILNGDGGHFCRNGQQPKYFSRWFSDWLFIIKEKISKTYFIQSCKYFMKELALIYYYNFQSAINYASIQVTECQ